MICKGKHVKFARFVLLAISEETKTSFFFVQRIIKLLLDSVFENNQGLVEGYQPQPLADNPLP